MAVPALPPRMVRRLAFFEAVSTNGAPMRTIAKRRTMNFFMVMNLLDLFRVSVSITMQDSGYCVNES